jgi:hypothetical protein
MGHQVAKPCIIALKAQRLEEKVVESLAGWPVELGVGRDKLAESGGYFHPLDDVGSTFASPEDTRLRSHGQGLDHIFAIRANPSSMYRRGIYAEDEDFLGSVVLLCDVANRLAEREYAVVDHSVPLCSSWTLREYYRPGSALVQLVPNLKNWRTRFTSALEEVTIAPQSRQVDLESEGGGSLQARSDDEGLHRNGKKHHGRRFRHILCDLQ